MAPPQHCTNQNREPCSKILLKYLSEIAGGYYYNIILGTYLYIYIYVYKPKRQNETPDLTIIVCLEIINTIIRIIHKHNILLKRTYT